MCHKNKKYIKSNTKYDKMSQIEQNIREFLAKKPEIEKCVQHGLVNRRALARHLIKQGIAKANEMEAVIATLRRFQFKNFQKTETDVFGSVQIRIKDNILILDFEKDKALMQDLKKIIDSANYDKGETLKIVIGTGSVTVFIDEANRAQLKDILRNYKLKDEHKHISEISLLFPTSAIETKGIISFLTRELFLHDILITEMLTANAELLLYIKEEYAVQAYELVKRLQQ